MAEAPWTPVFRGSLPLRDGIYRGLSPQRATEIASFLAQYRLVRARDGYRQRAAMYYASLPNVDRGDPQAETWRVRQESFGNLVRMLRRLGARRLRVLDLGAGCGWLSYRLTALGYSCVAVDWLDDPEDGLGAFRYYPLRFICMQADFDDLAIAPGQFDVAIFNASLHYSSDPLTTLRQAREMLAPGGTMVVMDSPMFATDASGHRMIDDQQVAFRSTCDQPMRWGVGFLTEAVLVRAALDTRLKWTWIPSRGGLAWAMKRRFGAIAQGRPAARFGLWFAIWQARS